MSTNDRPAQDEDHVMRAMRTAPIVEGDAAEQAAEEVGLRSIELAGLLPGLPDLIKFANEVADEEGAQYPAALGELARACELLLAEQADVTARPLAALRAAFSDVDPHSATVDMLEAHRAAAMWEARYREAEEAHARDAAVLKALRAEVERLRAPAPAGGADREAELDRIAAAQRERMGATAPPSDDMPDPDAFDPDDPGDTVAPEDADRAELIVSLLHRSTAELRALVAPPASAADLDAARAAAREARERAAREAAVNAEIEWGTPVAPNKAKLALAAHVETLVNEAERLRARVAELEAERGSREALALDDVSMDRAWGRALDLIRSDGLDPDEVIARATRTVEQMRPPTPPPAWTCTTCDTSGTAADLADDGNGPVCPQCRQARHLCMHGPAGWRVAALLAAAGAEVTDAQRLAHDSDDDRETIYQRGRHTGARIIHSLITAHLGAPSPLDVVVAEVLSVDVAAEVGPVTCMNDAYFKIDDLASVDGTEQDNWRDLVRIAAVALAGIRACDVLPTPMLSRSQMIARGMHDEVTEMDRKVSKKAGPHG